VHVVDDRDLRGDDPGPALEHAKPHVEVLDGIRRPEAAQLANDVAAHQHCARREEVARIDQRRR
jgi:hypothetical protein